MNLVRLSKFYEKLSSRKGRQEIYTRSISSLYTYEYFRKVSRVCFRTHQEPQQWLFLLGCYNSGTTILRDVLGSHPEIATMPREGVRFSTIFPTPEKFGWFRMTSRCPEGSMVPSLTDAASVRSQLIRDWAPWLGSHKPVFLEKSITHAARLQWIQEVFPDAKFIIIHRDGYSSAEGIQRKARAVGTAAQEMGGSRYSMAECAKEWDQLNRNLIGFSESNDDANVKVVSYEALCASPSTEISTLLEFAGVSKDCFSSDGKHGVNIDGHSFDIRNMNDKSHARLSDQDYHDINLNAGDTLRRLGYFLEGKSDE